MLIQHKNNLRRSINRYREVVENYKNLFHKVDRSSPVWRKAGKAYLNSLVYLRSLEMELNKL